MHKTAGRVFMLFGGTLVVLLLVNILFYLWEVQVLSRKIESVATTMQSVVSKHNGLTEKDYAFYMGYLNEIKKEMNSGGNEFVKEISLNYKKPCQSNVSITVDGVDIVGRELETLGEYGTVKVIEITVKFEAPVWRTVAAGTFTPWEKGSEEKKLVYTYVVPCLKYNRLEEIED